MQPTPEEIRAQLDRITASRSFVAAPRQARFLRFIVERTLAGHGDRLKEFAVGVEVFDRGAQFDPRVDSIVRVEASRLRTRLDDYYRGAGATDPVRISLGKGAYAPHFARPAPAPAAIGRRPHRLALVIAACAAALAVAAALLVGVQRDGSAPPAPPGAHAIAVLPFAPYARDEAALTFGEQLAESVSAELVRDGQLGVVPSARGARYADPRAIPDDVSQRLGARFVLRGRIALEGGQVQVETQLMDGELNRKTWTGSHTGTQDGTHALARQIAREAAAAVPAPD